MLMGVFQKNIAKLNIFFLTKRLSSHFFYLFYKNRSISNPGNEKTTIAEEQFYLQRRENKTLAQWKLKNELSFL